MSDPMTSSPTPPGLVELRPCPFCGLCLIRSGPFSTRNTDCYLHPQDVDGVDYGRCPGAGFRVFSNASDRIAAWNRRTPTEAADIIARLERTPVLDREAVARIIDPEAFNIFGDAGFIGLNAQAKARAKADAIIALSLARSEDGGAS